MRFLNLLAACAFVAGTLRAQAAPDSASPVYDLVIMNGRVMNPETRFDATANVGISGGTIVRIATVPLAGRRTIDAAGLVVAPGFIDILSYDPTPIGVWNKIADGVTTNLAMHGGSADPPAWYGAFERQHLPLNFGASFYYSAARSQLNLNRYQPASEEQIARLTTVAERALRQGALGVSFALEYTPGISAEEIRPLMRLARRYAVPVFFHARFSDMVEPGTNIDALNEIIGYATETGAAVHLDHITSTGGTFSMQQSLALLQQARDAGVDITACAYPYPFWATSLASARFDPGWQSRFRISFGDLQLGGSSERLTEQSFRRYRGAAKLAVAYAIPEDDVASALQSDLVMLGSDAILEPGFNNHPRASGTFARTLGRYARERQVIPLMDALAKMTIMPARRLERSTAAMRRKGRLSVGADADITILDYRTILDRATVEHPEFQSVGVEYVIVQGQIVKDPAGLHKGIRPGQAIRNEIERSPIDVTSGTPPVLPPPGAQAGPTDSPSGTPQGR
ncbi:MAG TPA: amidohydrolase family protein [Gemmatimonadales bacterium]|nr:amidohydrolase family protein [Gemmatimonadales bacterium]